MTTVTSALSARAVRLGAPRKVAVRRPARVAAHAATNPDADPARKPSVAKGASRLVSTATLGGIPVSLATALPALADDGGGGGGALGIVALIAVAGAAFVAGRGSGGGGGGGGDDDDPPPPTGSQDSKNYEKNLTIASGVQRKGRKPPKPKGL